MLFVKFSGADFRICCSEIRIWSHFIYLYIFDSASTFDIISYINEMPLQFSTHLRITQFGFMISIYCIYQVPVCLIAKNVILQIIIKSICDVFCCFLSS